MLRLHGLIETKIESRRQRQRSRFEGYQSDPVGFIEKELLGFVWSKQREICESVVKNRYTAVPACHGPGKALAANEPVLTPHGWTPIGALRVGDSVLAGDGSITQVIGVYPQGVRPLFRVTMSDGSSVRADADHRWFTTTRAERRAGKPGGVRTTADIFASLTFPNGAARGLNHMIPTAGIAQHPDRLDMPIDPYVLGQWLGDGDTVGRVCGAADQMTLLAKVTALNPWKYNSPGSWIASVPGLRPALRSMGLLGLKSYEKFIPRAYLHAGPAQREALLQGLMDTDGTVADNSLTFYSTSPQLAEDVAELARSLGGVVRIGSRIPKIGSVEHRRCYRITMSMPRGTVPFRLARKLASYRPATHANTSRQLCRFIQSIEADGEGDAVCIAVEHPLKTFITRDHIVTHNTGIAARISAWWLSAFPPGEALLVSTAPTGHQVRALLWREINKVHRAGRLPGRTNQTEWIMPPNEIVGFGVAVRDTDPTRFQGVHAPRVLVVIDEGCGVTRAILEAAETLVTNDDSRLLIIGNPDDPATGFADNCKPGSHYNVIPISAFDTPAYTGEKIPEYLRKVLVSRTWVEERKRKWGENSPMYVSKVLGRFPDISTDGLIPLGKLQEAINREMPAGAATFPNELGVDCARFGNDKTTIYHRVGQRVRRVSEHRRRDLMEIVGKVVKLSNMLGVTAIKIDDVGLGGGVTDRLNELRFLGKIKAKVVPIVVSRSPTTTDDQERFHNLRCQLAWSMRERFINDAICLLPAVDLIGDPNPHDPQPIEDGLNDLLAQAGAIKYKLMSTGHIHVETKEEMKKPPRSLPSPDDFDGLVLAFAPSDIGGEMVLPFQAVEVKEPATRVPQFWPQVVCIHIERQTIAAVWGAYHETSDSIHITDEYVAPLTEIPVHVEAIRRRSPFDVPAVMALKTDDRPKKVGVELASRMQRLGLPMLSVDEAPLEMGLPEMQARMQTRRLQVYDTCTGWFAELSRFRKNAEGEVLDGHIPLMHATSLLVQSGMQGGVSEAQAQSDEDAMEREARSFGETRSETGY